MVSFVGTAGAVLDVGLVSNIPLLVWTAGLVLCLVLAPALAHRRQEQRNIDRLAGYEAKMKELEDANRAMWYYNKLRTMESEARDVLNRLPPGEPHGSPVFERFIRDYLKPWVDEMQLFASGTRWENADLGEGMAANDPKPDWKSIYDFVERKASGLEDVHNAYGIVDGDD